MTTIPKLKLEVKSKISDIAKFSTSEKIAEILFTAGSNLNSDSIILGSSINEDDIFNITTYISTNNTSNKLATFSYTNTDLYTTTILNGDLVIEGSTLSLGTRIINDITQDGIMNPIAPRADTSNLITERYMSLLYSNIYSTSNKILYGINNLQKELIQYNSNIFTIQNLFKDISFISFNNSDFDNILISKTTNDLPDGTSNKYIINDTYPNNLIVNTDVVARELLTNTIHTPLITARYLYGDGSQLNNIYRGDGTTSSIIEGSNLFYKNERAIPVVIASNLNISNYINNVYSNVIEYNRINIIEGSNTIISTNENILNDISHNDANYSNILYNDVLRINLLLSSCNLDNSNYVSNIKISNNSNVNIFTNNINEYISISSNDFDNLNKILSQSSNTITDIFNIYISDFVNVSNNLVNNITTISNNISLNLLNNSNTTLVSIKQTSNYIDEILESNSSNNSNYIKVFYSDFDDIITSNAYNVSNIIDYDNNNLNSILLNNKTTILNNIYDTSNSLLANSSNIFKNISNFADTTSLDIFLNISSNYINSSNNILNISNSLLISSSNLYNKQTDNSINSSNYILRTSNDIIQYYINNNIDNSYDIDNMSNAVINELLSLNTDGVLEGTNKYFSSNKFNNNIQSISLDNINNGNSNKFITDNIYQTDLTILKEIQASNMIIMGTETVLLTNTINTEQLEIISSSFDTSLTIQQKVLQSNILDISIGYDSNIFTVQQGKIGINNINPKYSLDVNGAIKADILLGSGMYLYDVNLEDKTTSEIAEGSNKYYTDTRVSSLVNLSNINISNYMTITSNTAYENVNNLLNDEKNLLENASNTLNILITNTDVSQSNYILSTSNLLSQEAFNNLLGVNHSNYIITTSNNLNNLIDLYDTQQSNYIINVNNIVINTININNINASNYTVYVYNSNINMLSNNASNIINYVLSTSNIILGGLYYLDALQSNYTQSTSNKIINTFITASSSMSNYIIETSNNNTSKYLLNNQNNSNYILSTSNNITGVINNSISTASVNINNTPSSSLNTSNLNRWIEPSNYVSGSNVSTNYIQYSDGCIGIGLKNPQATLEIYTKNSSNSIKVNNNIWAQTGIIYSSDERIKNSIETIDSRNALEKILKIEPKIFNYVDEARIGKEENYGFIAQQIAEVIPNAVSIQSGNIPNIYCDGIINENNILVLSKDIGDILTGVKKIAVYYNNVPYVLRIEEVYDNNSYGICKIENQYNIYGNVFVYGSVVEDFNTIDKSYIYTLNVSASQDLYRQQEDIRNKITELKDKNSIYALEYGEEYLNKLKDDIDILNKNNSNFGIEYDKLAGDYNKLKDVNGVLINSVDKCIDIEKLKSDIEKIENDNNILQNTNEKIVINNNNLRKILNTIYDKILSLRNILTKNNMI